ncbi:helix-turn-helix domain-containing protein [Parasutterella secunda]|uniref:Helix-turn-helix domain-containing protein n=1 Tax=Parasutterella secunda TaxID=626947 RepID=A0ABS2GV94_9BURK|nr:helix-turn-helix domain-containing protein [Parasutterella secunda]
MSFVSYQFRIYPNSLQRQSLIDHFGCTRWVFNRYLSEADDCYKQTGKTMRCHDFIVRLVDLKKQYPWLKDVNSQSLQMAARNAERAFVNFFLKNEHNPLVLKANIPAGSLFTVLNIAKFNFLMWEQKVILFSPKSVPSKLFCIGDSPVRSKR